jgi:RNA polymerase sigma-70 factor (ECF subfamily)
MTRPKADTEELLQRAAEGDTAARQQLFVRHQHRLRQMVAVRMDRRLAARVDPSDLVQEALMDAHRKLNDYLRDRPLPFYPWLRRLAWERLLQLHRRHLHADRRSVLREEPMALPDESALQLANRLEGRTSSPSDRAVRRELRERLRSALARLPDRDREVLVLRYLEQLSNPETAAVLGITAGAVRVRHTRALERLHALLGENEP